MNEKLDFDENNPIDLLEEALYYLNRFRNARGYSNCKTSYELASKIHKYLEKHDTKGES